MCLDHIRQALYQSCPEHYDMTAVTVAACQCTVLQASATLAHTLQAETQQRNRAVADLKAQTAVAQAWLQTHSNPTDDSEESQLDIMTS